MGTQGKVLNLVYDVWDEENNKPINKVKEIFLNAVDLEPEDLKSFLDQVVIIHCYWVFHYLISKLIESTSNLDGIVFYH